MTDRSGSPDGNGTTTILVAALIALAIVLLLLFARGPEGEQRSAATPTVVAALVVRA